MRELTELVDEPQNLVSYHLRLLRDGGLVSSQRSSADGRDSYYTIDLTRCRDELQEPRQFAASRTLARADSAQSAGDEPTRATTCAVPMHRQQRSSLGKYAEALLGELSDGTIDVTSAGSHPKQLHPNAVQSHPRPRDRHQRQPHQAPRRVPIAALRSRRHAVRQGPRGVSGLPVRTAPRALEHRRPRARRLDEPRVLSGVPTHR